MVGWWWFVGWLVDWVGWVALVDWLLVKLLIGVGRLSCWLVSWLVSWLVGRVCWLSWLGGCGWLVVVAVWLGGWSKAKAKQK